MKSFKDDDIMRSAYQQWAITIANRFDRSYPRIGILNFSDLIQEGYVGFYKAWGKLNWDLINSHLEEERVGMITNYLKISIKRHIVRAITRDRDTIRIPEHYYMEKHDYGNGVKSYDTDIFLTRTFSTFEKIIDAVDEHQGRYTDELNELLNDVMDRFLKSFEKTVLMQLI